MMRFLRKVIRLFGRDRFHAELDEEMAFHREQAERELMAGGASSEEARYAAKRQFGNQTRLRERSHEVVGFKLESVAQDVRFALRQLRRNPGFAVTAAVILALGMGVSVAIFGFVDAALLEPLPYTAPNRLVAVDESSAMFPRSNLSYDDYIDWKRENKTLSALEVYAGTGFLLHTASGTEPIRAARVSAGFFDVLGVRAMLGRTFLPGEDRPGGARIVLLPFGTWVKRFGARRDVVGQTVNLDGNAYTIVGVLPRDFSFAPRGNAEFFAPLLDRTGCEQRRSCHGLDGIGRLRDGVSRDAALADLKGIAAQLALQYPGSNQGQGASVIPLTELVTGDVRPILLMLLGGAGLLLVIACVNVASLLLVRSETRRRETAVRGALGATRQRLVRQFLTEGLLLGGAGCLGGACVAIWMMALLKHLVPKDVATHLPFLENVGLNVHTVVFAAAIALMAGVVFAVTPILRLTFLPIHDGLADGGRGTAGRLWRKLGANLVVVELAVATVLLVSAALLGKSFYKLLHVDNGFDTSHLASMQIMAPDAIYINDKPRLIALYGQIERRLKALPGVESVGLSSDLPLQCNCDTDWLRFVGKPYHGEHNEVNERDITPGYLETLKAQLVRGRLLTEDDTRGKPQVIVINETLARTYYPGENPIGQKVANGSLDPDSMREIVGVIKDVREGPLDANIWPAEYLAMKQQVDTYFSVAVRTTNDERAILPVMVKAVREIDPGLGVLNEITMKDQMEGSQSAMLHRVSTWLVGGFAGMALVLGVVGLYGVVAYSVSQRTREIGVRMALGAGRGTVYRMVLGEASWLIGLGCGLGLAGAVGAALLMGKLLFGVAAWDPAMLAAVASVLGGAALLASFLPARRAAGVNPTDALRAE